MRDAFLKGINKISPFFDPEAFLGYSYYLFDNNLDVDLPKHSVDILNFKVSIDKNIIEVRLNNRKIYHWCN